MSRRMRMRGLVCAVAVSAAVAGMPLRGAAAVRAAAAAPEPPYVTADAAVLLDAVTGRVLYEKNARQERDPASTTKVMTALLALEMGNPDDVVTVSPWAAGTEGSTMHLKPGDRYALGELLKGLLLVSGNDAAAAIAEHLAGSERDFGILMTARARELGLDHSRFRNPHGLTEPGHYSSAYDLARIAREALRLPGFADLVCRGRAESCGVDAAGRAKVQSLWNTNRLLFSYQWADGVKTGTTAAAGNCLVASASRYGQQVIAVVLHSDDRWRDALRLLDWGFGRFALRNPAPAGTVIHLAPVRGARARRVALTPAHDLNLVVERRDLGRLRTVINVNPDLRAPLPAGAPAGSLTVLAGETVLGRVPLVTMDAVPLAPWWLRLWRAVRGPGAG